MGSAVRAPVTRVQAETGPGEVSEAARGQGLRRAVGELLVCPYCLGLWIAAAFTAGLVVAPRPTRWVASALAAAFGSDLLQIAYKQAEDSLQPRRLAAWWRPRRARIRASHAGAG